MRTDAHVCASREIASEEVDETGNFQPVHLVRIEIAHHDARERLILHYSPLVKFVAGRVAAGLPQSIEQSDLVSYGIFGLIDAIDKFDPERGFKFETYAISRIKGAIIDELRSIDWVPRSVRSKARTIERAYSKLENELKRSPSDEEMATELGISESELAQTLSQISFVGVVALDEVVNTGEKGGGKSHSVIDPCAMGDHRERCRVIHGGHVGSCKNAVLAQRHTTQL